ncbi:PREDICTED: myb-like protein J isoform X2 [Ipomoea nil]|uniref:myb-like protein J isoform X2 n=1 Tax=Ipomoea nil TaxID=35883 RepID=UPI000901E661|nr:PREDICTED: myb-like protein J isoform X2 [Ipomoea nil]
MGRKCSKCGITGHNSRTCTTVKGCIISNTNNNVVVGGLRLFGVQLEISSSSSLCSSPSSSSTNSSIAMKKSLSLDCLSSSPSSSPHSSTLVSVHENCEIKTSINGYLSDGLIGKAQEKRKEKEHRNFMNGLEKLGKGDWRGISRKFVSTRTPTQVASHAQKYFLRLASLNHKKRRASLFDMVRSHNHKANHEDDQENVHSLIDLNSFGDDDQEMRVMMMTTINDDGDQVKCKTSSNHHHSAEALDLGLALGAPKDVDKPKPSSTSTLLGPISVT